MNICTVDRRKAFEGLHPAFSAHVSWREHGATVECAVARSVAQVVTVRAHDDGLRGDRRLYVRNIATSK